MSKQSRFINPLTDFGFKRIFGDEEILLSFLNDLFEGEIQIKSLKQTCQEMKGISPDSKTIIYDIHCITDDGRHVIIEMQNLWTDSFRDRMLFYTARDIANQGKAGEANWKYSDLKAVYSVFILNFDLFKENGPQSFRHDIKLIDVTTNRQFTDKMRMVCLQLPLTITKESSKKNRLDSWMYNLRNMETMKNLAYTEEMPIFKKLEQIAEYSKLSPEDQYIYDCSYKAWLDEYTRECEHQEGLSRALTKGRAEGRIEGRAEGMKEGRAEGIAIGEAKAQYSIAKSLKSQGLDTNSIALATGLTIEEIDKL